MSVYYQVDSNGIFLGRCEYDSAPFLGVSAPVPAAPEGYVAVWTSALDPVADPDWGIAECGEWTLLEDFRSVPLYTADGLYAVGTDHQGQAAYSGIGPLPSWLGTVPPPPSSDGKVSSVTRLQGILALDAAGLLDQVEAAVANPDTPREVKMAWQYALSFERESPALSAIAQAIGLSERQLDELFLAAAGIRA